MKKIINIVLIIFLVSSFSDALIAEDIYRWVDGQGKVHYGNKPKNKDAKIFDKKALQSIETVKTKINPVRIPKSNRNVRNRNQNNSSQCNKLKSKLNSLESEMGRITHGVKAFERYKNQIKNLKEKIRKSC